MNINEVRSIIRQTIAEAIEEKKGGLPKSGNTLVELKKELKSLKGMQEAMGQFNLSEGGDGGFIAEYAHMQKFVNEFNKLKDAHSKLSEMLSNQIGLTEERIDTETKKIKELMGLIPKESAKKDKKVKKESDPAGQKMAGNPDEEAESRSNAKSMAKAKSKPTDKPVSKPAAKKNK
jgi:flagellar biosynthesis chaperone FliJ